MRNSTFFRPLSILILFTIYSGFLYAEQYAYKQISQKKDCLQMYDASIKNVTTSGSELPKAYTGSTETS